MGNNVNENPNQRKRGLMAAVIIVIIAAVICIALWFTGIIGGISAAEAENIARAQTTDSDADDQVITVKEFDDGRMKYDVQIIHDNMLYEFEILARNGKIISQDIETSGGYAANSNSNSVQTDTSVQQTSDIGIDKAREIVLANVSGAISSDIVKAKADRDNGRMVYEIELIYGGFEYDFEIDAATGDIISQDMEKH